MLSLLGINGQSQRKVKVTANPQPSWSSHSQTMEFWSSHSALVLSAATRGMMRYAAWLNPAGKAVFVGYPAFDFMFVYWPDPVSWESPSLQWMISVYAMALLKRDYRDRGKRNAAPSKSSPHPQFSG
jgi:hypothetical protein